MPMIAVILGTFALWTVYWFVRMGGINHIQARRRAREEAERAAAARTAARNAPLRAVDDPRDAAIVLMLLMARENGDPTREHIAEIERIARAAFGFDRDLTEHMTQARFIASRAESFAQAAAVLADLFNKHLTREEKRELVDMLGQAADFEGEGAAHGSMIDALARRVGLLSAS